MNLGSAGDGYQQGRTVTGYDAMAGILVYALSRSLRNYRSRLQEGIRVVEGAVK